ncbi:MAG: 30S ribosomal protein S20, partial [Eubacteriales bacterium]
MPNIKSAKKRVLVNKSKAQRNKSQNTALKTAVKKAHAAVTANVADKDAVVKAAIKKVDQAAAKG